MSEIAATQATADVTVTTTAETVAVTSAPVKMTKPVQRVVVLAFCQLTVGVGGTFVTPRVRRGSLTGTIIDEGNPITVVAGEEVYMVLFVDDELTNAAEATYVMTVGVSGASGNSTVKQASILAITL